MSTEDPPEARLSHRVAAGRTSQNHEALRRGASRRSLGAEVAGEFPEEDPVDGDHSLSPALAEDPDPPESHIDIAEQRPP